MSDPEITEELQVCPNGAVKCDDKDIKLEFQPYIYMLDNDAPSKGAMDMRHKLMVHSSRNINDDNDSIYLYGMLPVDKIPAAYLPFRYDNPDINFNKLTYNDTLPDNYYTNVFRVNDKILKSKTDAYPNDNARAVQEFKKELKTHFSFYLVDRLHNPLSIFNSFISKWLVFYTCIFWMIILIFLMKMLYYHFSSVYTYVIFGMIIALLVFAVLWKMFYTLQ